MNRVIKFRIWDNKRKEWTWTGINILGEVICFGEILCRRDDTHVKVEELNDLIVMQFTGLKDINDKDVYEWDIVKWAGDIYVVDYNLCYFKLDNLDGSHAGIMEDSMLLEVIGNACENPELLDDQ